MKHLRKMMAYVISLVMIITSFGASPAFAWDDPDPNQGQQQIQIAQAEPREFTGGDFKQEVETTITAENLTKGDSIGYFQLIEWDSDKGGWKLTTIGSGCGVTLPELLNGITEAEATTIASKVTGDGTAMGLDAQGTTATAKVAAGLYFLRAKSVDNNTVYNPAFVSADYYEGGNTVDLSDYIGSSAVLKKSDILFDKEVTGIDQFIDTKPGDVIPYKITTQVPSYGTRFTHPVFKITDTLSAGLELNGDITVKYDENSTTETVAGVVTIKKNDNLDGFIVEFDKDYLIGLNGATPTIEITYSAEVTTEALENVTYMDNVAKLTYTNNNNETSDKEDLTRHYTFSIDAKLNGGNHGNEKTRELIKIGVDKNNNVITDFTSWVEGEEWTTYTPLAGAEFSLVGNNKTYTATSTDQGYISFYGLDAGEYTLTETAAPSGYVRDTKEYAVVITPTYDTPDNPDVLISYTVTIDGKTTSTYTITKMNDKTATVETTVDNSSKTFPFINTKGTELPSTGGIGTTIFYIVGGVMVAGAVVFLLTKRRMAGNE
jgi:fimbrial isopeptide formation D2 family protein/LPXTG-motif cell wall-anchored protein